MYVDDASYLLKQLVKQSSDILYNQSSVWRKKRPNLKIRAIVLGHQEFQHVKYLCDFSVVQSISVTFGLLQRTSVIVATGHLIS